MNASDPRREFFEKMSRVDTSGRQSQISESNTLRSPVIIIMHTGLRRSSFATVILIASFILFLLLVKTKKNSLTLNKACRDKSYFGER